jgi:hypothetical protein
MLSVREILNKGRYKIEEARARRLSSDPVYHYHIRKTAGTSVNFAFIRQAVGTEVETTYERLAKKPDHRLIQNRKVLVSWNKTLIQQGNYHYAFSHLPAHALQLPEKVRKITCFRDPLKRIISHYNMLQYYQLNHINHPSIVIEGKWLGDGFSSFLEKIEKPHLLAQLYMFSESYSVGECMNFLMKNQVHILKTETLSEDILTLGTEFKMELTLGAKEKDYGHREEISASDIEKARQLLSKEYELMEQLNQIKH